MIIYKNIDFIILKGGKIKVIGDYCNDSLQYKHNNNKHYNMKSYNSTTIIYLYYNFILNFYN